MFGLVILIVYTDDILPTGTDPTSLAKTKEYLKHHFVTKDTSKPKYFLGIKVSYHKHGLLLSQRKCVLDLLEEVDCLGCKPARILMDANLNLLYDSSHLLEDMGWYRRLIRKLIYLTVTTY